MNPNNLKMQEPFKGLFPVSDETLKAVRDHMEKHGYDQSQPVIVWNKRDGGDCIVVDGHTRVQAAIDNGLMDIPVDRKEFGDEDAAFKYAVHNQRDRRNLTDADILRLVGIVDERKKAGRKKKNRGQVAPIKAPKSRVQTAELIGTSDRKVQRTRTVLDHADPQTKQEVLDGKKTINAAYTETQCKREVEKERSKSKPVFKKTTENIEWACKTWNPIVGCKHDCQYCYARDIAIRSYGNFEPNYFPDRLTAPQNTPKPKSDKIEERNVFVCSMGDLFGEWVPKEQIDAVMEAVRKASKWNFIFLTKNPKRLIEVDWPDNCWVGAIVDIQDRVKPTMEAFKKFSESNRPKVLFVSCEPLMEKLKFEDEDLALIDWLIIGGRGKSSGMSEGQPEWKWVEYLLAKAREAKIKVYMKPNLTVRPREYPAMERSVQHGR